MALVQVTSTPLRRNWILEILQSAFLFGGHEWSTSTTSTYCKRMYISELQIQCPSEKKKLIYKKAGRRLK
ncbi:25_t:CDS:2 [Entrophospora sp. SA101]|nr:25_t:CDS:2 [Entrophospora sp. SA101]